MELFIIPILLIFMGLIYFIIIKPDFKIFQKTRKPTLRLFIAICIFFTINLFSIIYSIIKLWGSFAKVFS